MKRAVCSVGLLSTALISTNSYAQSTSWLTAADGDWTNAAAWSLGIPDAATQAVINATGSPYAVTLAEPNAAANGLLLDSIDASFNHLSGELDLQGSALDLRSGTYRLGTAALRNAEILSNGGTFVFLDTANAGSILDNISLGAGDFAMQSDSLNDRIFLRTALTGTGGSLTLLPETRLTAESPLTISNLPIVVAPSSGLPGSLLGPASGVVTLDSQSSYTGTYSFLDNVRNDGLIRAVAPATDQRVGLEISGTFENTGTTEATNDGRVRFDAAALQNTGTLIATNGGTLAFDNLASGSSIGDVTLDGGTLEFQLTSTSWFESMSLTRTSGDVVLTDVWDNQTDLFTLDSSVGDLELRGGLFFGGSLAFADGAALLVGPGRNLLDQAQIASGTVRSTSLGRLELRPGWQQDVSSLDVDGVRLALAGTLSFADLNRFNFSNGSVVDIAGDLDLQGATLSTAAVGRDVVISNGLIHNGVFDNTDGSIVFSTIDGLNSEGELRDVTVLGDVIVESGRAELTGSLGIDGVRFFNRTSQAGALRLEVSDTDFGGGQFTAAEGELTLFSNSLRTFSNGTVNIEPTAQLSVQKAAQLENMFLDFASGGALRGDGRLSNVVLGGTPVLDGSLRLTNTITAQDPALVDGGIRFFGQTTLVGDFVGSPGVSNQLFSFAQLTIAVNSSFTGSNELRDNGSNATLNVDGLLAATGSSDVLEIGITNINVSGSVEAVGGGTVFLGDFSSSHTGSGQITATADGIMNVSGLFQPGEFGDRFSAPGGTLRLGGEIQNANATITVDDRFSHFALGHRDAAFVFDGVIDATQQPVHVEQSANLFGTQLIGDVIVRGNLRLEAGATAQGSIHLDNGRLVAFDADPASPVEGYSLSFEGDTVTSSEALFVGQDRSIEFGPDRSIAGHGGRVNTSGTNSAVTTMGVVRATSGAPLRIESASITLNGLTVVGAGATLELRDASAASADGDATTAVLDDRLSLSDSGLFDVVGSLELTANASTLVKLSALPSQPLMQVSESATLSGDFWLDASLFSNVSSGDSFTLLNAASVTGSFANVGATALSPFLPIVSFGATDVTVTLLSTDYPLVGGNFSGTSFTPRDSGPVPAPGTLCFLALTGGYALGRRRSIR